MTHHITDDFLRLYGVHGSSKLAIWRCAREGEGDVGAIDGNDAAKTTTYISSSFLVGIPNTFLGPLHDFRSLVPIPFVFSTYTIHLHCSLLLPSCTHSSNSLSLLCRSPSRSSSPLLSLPLKTRAHPHPPRQTLLARSIQLMLLFSVRCSFRIPRLAHQLLISPISLIFHSEFAQVLEQLESTFYQKATTKFKESDFAAAGYVAKAPLQIFDAILDHENNHTA